MVVGDPFVSVKKQRGEQRALLAAAEFDRAITVPDRQRSEDPEFNRP